MAMILILAAPAGAAAQPRDTVIETASVGSARISASATANRYPIDASGRETVAIAVTAACQASCTAADPRQIAAFLGTLIHGFEMQLLTVQLDTPSQLEFDCGYGAQACYYGGENKIVISGNDAPATDGASREFVLAHEYGHHVARHRETPRPFPAALDWGTARWSSYQNVCRRARAGVLSVGSFGLRYFRDPGEAFAESFAHLRFPESGVPWRWLRALKPDAGALEAIRKDTLDPWLGRTPLRLAGRVPPRGEGPAVRAFRTPLDGAVSLRPAGRPRYDLSLLNRAGRVLRSSRHDHGRNGGQRLNFTVCGQSRLRLAIHPSARRAGAFKLQIQRP
ncbi:MAG: hypothetical protein WDZ46_03370 [Solirubrobacterales bacterium]